MAPDASDERQLLEASARGRCILTHNISDFMRLAQMYSDHGGIVLAHQTGWTLSELIARVDCCTGQDADRDRCIRLARSGALAQ